VDGVDYAGADAAAPAPGVLEALGAADGVVLAPSNPYLSLGPILAIDDIRRAVQQRNCRCVAVSPLVGGRAVSGPLDRMLSRMAGGKSPAHVAELYAGLLDALVVHGADLPATAPVPLVAAATLMRDGDDARRLAQVVLEAACG
jgi:LPPG:FO 2-phospho-L-lactate transferase